MDIRYVVVDANERPVRIYFYDDGISYDVVEVPLNDATLFKERAIAERELTNINRIKDELDNFSLFVKEPVELPLKVMGVKVVRQLFAV